MDRTPTPDALADLRALLGRRCRGVRTVSPEGLRAFLAAGPVMPVHAESFEGDRVVVADLKARAAELGKQGLPLVVDATVPGPYLCPGFIRGASAMVRRWRSPDKSEAVVTLGFAGPKWTGAAESQLRAMEQTLDEVEPVMPTVPAWLGEAIAELPAVSQARADGARVVAEYLRCAPSVTAVSYPGLKGDSSNEVAARTLEHGFGPLLAFRTEHSAADLRESLAEYPTPTSDGASVATRLEVRDDGSVRMVVGTEEPLALVMWLEALL